MNIERWKLRLEKGKNQGLTLWTYVLIIPVLLVIVTTLYWLVRTLKKRQRVIAK